MFLSLLTLDSDPSLTKRAAAGTGSVSQGYVGIQGAASPSGNVPKCHGSETLQNIRRIPVLWITILSWLSIGIFSGECVEDDPRS
jgi:hypothetical protein